VNLPRDLAGLHPLAGAIRELLPRQRWFAGERSPQRAEPVACVWVRRASPAVALTVWEVGDAQGAIDRYHLPLGFRSPEQPLPPGVEALRPDEGAGPEGGAWVAYEGLTDPELSAHLLTWMDQPGAERCLGGRVIRRRAAGSLPLEPNLGPRPLEGDHSNSGVVFGDRVMLKVFRRLWPGINPEAELTTCLLAAGFDRVPRPLLALEMEAAGGPFSLAAAQLYLPHGTDGFQLALTSLRDLFGDIHFEADGAVPMPEACVQAVSSQGGSFETDSARLGLLTGRMHRALAQATGPEMEAEPIRDVDLARWADEIEGALERLLALGDDRLEALRPQAAGVHAAAARLRQLSPGGRRIRLHGDFHLGQLLRVDDGWVVLDFEGQPAQSIAERRQKRSPLQDVAGMLRSFDYAAAVAVRQQASPDEPRWSSLTPYGRTWAERNGERFLAGYLAEVAGTGLLPAVPGSVDTLLTAFQLGKALYEVGYELAHRPEWSEIPLAEIARLRAWGDG